MIDNQLARRNLTDEQRAYFVGRKYLERKKAKGGDRKSIRQSDGLIGETAAQVAGETGVSPRTVERNGAFAESVDAIAGQDPEAAAAILNGTSGKSKEEVIEEVKGKGRKKREAKKREAKNGTPVYSWKRVDKALGVLARELDDMADAAGLPRNHSKRNALHGKIKELEDMAKAIHSRGA
jgi:hypothetical protein